MRRRRGLYDTPPEPQAIDPASGFKVPRSDVSPRLSRDDIVDHGLRDAVSGGKALQTTVGHPFSPDLQDVLIGKLGGVMRRALSPSAPAFPAPLGVHVSSVIEGRPVEKMGRVAADRIVTTMADKSRRGMTVGNLKGHSVNVEANAVVSEASVSLRLSAPGPFPTRIGRTKIHTARKRAGYRAIALHRPFAAETQLAILACNYHVPLLPSCAGGVNYA